MEDGSSKHLGPCVSRTIAHLFASPKSRKNKPRRHRCCLDPGQGVKEEAAGAAASSMALKGFYSYSMWESMLHTIKSLRAVHFQELDGEYSLFENIRFLAGSRHVCPRKPGKYHK